jgi:hypothetical protein
METHPIHRILLNEPAATEEESLLAAAVVLLSTQPRFAKMTVEQVYDEVKRHRDVLQPRAPSALTD